MRKYYKRKEYVNPRPFNISSNHQEQKSIYIQLSNKDTSYKDLHIIDYFMLSEIFKNNCWVYSYYYWYSRKSILKLSLLLKKS
ncbi:hypothetical protein RCL_jg27540.t1 [Rhizophagus clarus]|uniref:Uncharacterized protein n=1 Tax=Rhizophagus clarus TaxID=94130 RepID=A0A8H3QWJ3_9GLOM|nr:hypothetical protein RCL_jg27540.t1 [Rhizophagus clarus]